MLNILGLNIQSATINSIASMDRFIILTNDQSTLATTTITLAGMTGEISWGDGSASQVIAGETTYTHDYSSTGSYTIRIVGGLSDLTKIEVINQLFISGNISFLSNCPLLTYTRFDYTSVTGDISVLVNCPLLTYARFGNTLVTGDISVLSNCPLLTYARFGNTSVTGNISVLVNCPLLDHVYFYNTSVTGDVAVLANCPLLTFARFNNTSVVYTSTNLPKWDDAIIDVSDCGWTQTMVDNFIIDVAAGTGTTPANLILIIDGTNASRSSASDDAVIAIVDAGGSVTANGGSFGAELIVDGSFDTACGVNWVCGTAWTIGSGLAHYDDVTSVSPIQSANLVIETGKNYRLIFDVLNVTTNGNLAFANETGALLNTVLTQEIPYTDGTYTINFESELDATKLYIYGFTSSSDAFDIDNVSLREVLP